MEKMEGTSESDKVIAIENRHKKEKRELQAQIQAMKKTAKNDKSKKRELTVEIARLESELELRHQQELNAALEDPGSDEEQGTLRNEVARMKVTKAQRRRDKKSQQEKERQNEIKLQEKENIHGPRNVETQTICAKLKGNNLKIFPIPSDGDCLYKAVGHQLITTRQKSLTIEELRKNVAAYIKQNKDEFLPFMSNPETCNMLTDEEFDEYCEKVSSTKVWGGQLEIRALSNSLKCPISVIQATTDSIKQGTEFEGPPLIITYHRHMYSLGEHYNSTCICDEVEEYE